MNSIRPTLRHPENQLLFLLLLILPLQLSGSTATELNVAKAANEVAFVLVTEPSASEVDAARQMITAAMSRVNNSVLVELDRSLPENKPLVNQYRVGKAPVPLILVVDSRGTVAGGNIAAKLSANTLVAMVPSPKKSEVLKALSEGKSVFVAVGSSNMPLNSAMKTNCEAACQQLSGKSTTVQVDLKDKAELRFIRELKVDPNTAEPVTVVFNQQGKISGTFDDIVNVNTLVQTATKQVKSCCSKGSGKSCKKKKE